MYVESEPVPVAQSRGDDPGVDDWISRLGLDGGAGECRSGRDVLRATLGFALTRGGKRSAAFGGNERRAAQNGRHVMMPSRVPPAFEVIEAKLALEVVACSGACRSPIPEHVDHPFRRMPITDSGHVDHCSEGPLGEGSW